MFKWLRRKLLTGLVVILPTTITAWVIYKIFISFDSILKPLVERYPFLDLPGLGFISVILLILLVGILASNLIGRTVIGWIESLVTSIPLVSRIYTAIKQISEVFLRQRRTAFTRAVLIEYPRRGIYSIGFVTSAITIKDSEGNPKRFINIFLPTTPNPTSGFYLMIPQEGVIPINCSVEEALKLVISGGAVLPPGTSELVSWNS
jgi:uncharacterized membrane protein